MEKNIIFLSTSEGLVSVHPDKTGPFKEVSDCLAGFSTRRLNGHPVGGDTLEIFQGGCKRVADR
jgi:hypothetical protein